MLQYDVHPFLGLTFGPTTFMICVLGGLGNMVGGFIASFVFAEIISVSGLYLDLEWGYVFAFAFFIAMMFARGLRAVHDRAKAQGVPCTHQWACLPWRS